MPPTTSRPELQVSPANSRLGSAQSAPLSRRAQHFTELLSNMAQINAFGRSVPSPDREAPHNFRRGLDVEKM